MLRRRDLFERRAPHGLELLTPDATAELVARVRERGFFVEREHAERDPELKQIIPYCVLRRGGDVFLMRRLAAGGDARLHGKRSIGVGGHVEPPDRAAGGGDVVVAALRRELSEELTLAAPCDVRAVGVLNDDSTEVGAVHAGLVFVGRTAGAVSVRETAVLEGEFVPATAVERLAHEERSTFETWSALLIDRLVDLRGD